MTKPAKPKPAPIPPHVARVVRAAIEFDRHMRDLERAPWPPTASKANVRGARAELRFAVRDYMEIEARRG